MSEFSDKHIEDNAATTDNCHSTTSDGVVVLRLPRPGTPLEDGVYVIVKYSSRDDGNLWLVFEERIFVFSFRKIE
jgi:hypothetical protein